MRRGGVGPSLLVLLASALLLGAAGLAGAEVLQSGDLRVSVSTRLTPFRLPRTGTAPVGAKIAGHIATVDGAVPPQLIGLDILVNRHGQIDSSGLPSCTLDRIQPGDNARALRECGAALVGSGHFWATVVFAEDQPYHTTGRLLIFAGRQTTCPTPVAGESEIEPPSDKAVSTAGSTALFENSSPVRMSLAEQVKDAGRRARGARFAVRDPKPPQRGRRDAKCQSHPAVFAHIYTTQPFPTSFVIAFAVKPIDQGPWGTELSAELPSALGSWGYLDRIKLNLGRTYRSAGGRERGYIEAGCPAPTGASTVVFPLARAELSFADGEELGETITRPCGVKS
jgi:hypothetical protein